MENVPRVATGFAAWNDTQKISMSPNNHSEDVKVVAGAWSPRADDELDMVADDGDSPMPAATRRRAASESDGSFEFVPATGMAGTATGMAGTATGMAGMAAGTASTGMPGAGTPATLQGQPKRQGSQRPGSQEEQTRCRSRATASENRSQIGPSSLVPTGWLKAW